MVCTILSWQPCKRKMKRVTQVPAWPPTTKHPDHVWAQFLSASLKSKKLPSRALASFLFLWMPASLVRGFLCAPINFWLTFCFYEQWKASHVSSLLLSGILSVFLIASLPGEMLPYAPIKVLLAHFLLLWKASQVPPYCSLASFPFLFLVRCFPYAPIKVASCVS